MHICRDIKFPISEHKSNSLLGVKKLTFLSAQAIPDVLPVNFSYLPESLGADSA